ncbi:MAG: TM2 domain-containing protein [Sodaliphilus pleomorphus]|jgi:hypothetical protein|uniref:TM2 domain-containing protein n=1 Tax=Sodaliphilus pleomorphus TaxID=2606626 RepID=UPI0023F4C25D|nr:TM2 domain-containing protein [Sodaliphilus pleomorphus]MCI5979536.1 TM2 domain-containing protein [Muribaculaceae bacterium]MDY6251551.1 TM2 domain-containing protein [Bacteroidales bacterium]MCI6169493.1 TM2 domain-containing protein [Muribaculaceae bacterium]MDD7066955.1 TM2 domain-containing protein [Sodaliphilus pleomorphus]MDY2832142.1 TM2 domain-containing protein [Sodaliphilus pleomorphus]
MNNDQIAQFMLLNGERFSGKDAAEIRAKLESVSEQGANQIMSTEWKSPGKCLWFAGFLGGFGADRFYLGQTVLGIVKLLTGGGLGIWSIIDFWNGLPNCKKANLKKLRSIQ